MASVDTINASSPFFFSSSSFSSSSSSLPFTNIFYEGGKKFDVFLNFRGSDTRKNFTDYLFTAMNQKGISTFRDDEKLERGISIGLELLIAIEESKFAVVVLSRSYASSAWCLAELVKIVECMEKKKLIVLPIFYHVDPRDVRHQTGDFAVAFAEHEARSRNSTRVSLWRDALTKVANISGCVLNYGDPESQLIHEFIESLSNQVVEDGSTNWNLPPRFDVTPYESDDADEMVQDYVADLPLEAHVVPDDVADVPQEDHVVEDHVANLPQEAHVVEDHVANLQQIVLENESLSNLSTQMLEDGSDNLDLPPRFDDSHDEAVNDVDEMVQDYATDLPREAHVVPDDVADVPQEAHVVEDHVANLPQEAHVVEDHVANLQQACPICVTKARNMAFLCGHTTCVECGERLDTCHICREPISCRIRLFLG